MGGREGKERGWGIGRGRGRRGGGVGRQETDQQIMVTFFSATNYCLRIISVHKCMVTKADNNNKVNYEMCR